METESTSVYKMWWWKQKAHWFSGVVSETEIKQLYPAIQLQQKPQGFCSVIC